MHIGDAQLSLRVFWRVLEGGVKASKKAQSQESTFRVVPFYASLTVTKYNAEHERS
jgi:hypothetical protein